MAEFVDEVKVNDEYEVLTDQGWSEIISIGKTIPYKLCSVYTKNHELTCADEHIVFDKDFNEVFVKDLKLGDLIQTETGLEEVVAIDRREENPEENMYDLCLDDENHRYWTNGILSHNSTIYTIFATHYVLFNKDKKILMVANKEATVKELLQRIKMAWTLMPDFLKIGVTTWSAKKIELENGSTIMISATSPDSARGSSCDVCIDDSSWVTLKIGSESIQAPISQLVGKVNTVDSRGDRRFTFKELLDDALKYEPDEDFKVLTDPERLSENKARHQLQYHIENRNMTIPVCPICGKKLTDRFRNDHYYATCSVSCSKKLSKLAQDQDPSYDGVKILTNRGFEKFDGISINNTDRIIEITSVGERKIRCTKTHKFLTPLGLKEASEIVPGDTLSGLISDKQVSKVKVIEQKDHVYDIINSGKNNLFVVNGDFITHNCILDEAAFIDNGKMQEFVDSVFPTISSKPDGKIIAVSTPNGVGNWFERTYHSAIFGEGDDDFKWNAVTFPWYEHPYRDEVWKKKQLASLNFDDRAFAQEFECQFLGSSSTLFDPATIKHFTEDVLKGDTNKFDLRQVYGHKVKVWKDPIKDHAYVIGADIADGSGNDTSVLQIFDVTDCSNIEQVASFSSREIGVNALATLTAKLGARYNYAVVSGERNGVGVGYFDNLFEVYDYGNTVNYKNKSEMADRPGIYSTNTNKIDACLWAKSLALISVQPDTKVKIKIREKMTCGEMEYFESKSRNRVVTYQASKNNHDDFIMSFIWALFVLQMSQADNYFNVRRTIRIDNGVEFPALIQPFPGSVYTEAMVDAKVGGGDSIAKQRETMNDQANRDLITDAIYNAISRPTFDDNW